MNSAVNMYQQQVIEANLDGVAGPTHHFGGLGVGNRASLANAWQMSYPVQAALEGLAKARLIASYGVPQFLLPPPPRPRLDLLASFGFSGNLGQQLEAAAELAPELLSAIYSSAFVWMANCATVTPASDASDHRLHLTPANLISSWHRAYEVEERRQQLLAFFSTTGPVTIHEPLPAIVPLRDEGAANHLRLCDRSGTIGLNIFVFGDPNKADQDLGEGRFFPRQTRQASAMISRRHRLDPSRVIMLQQHPRAIQAGAFHNDVIATCHQNLFIHHEHAFWEGNAAMERLEVKFRELTGESMLRLPVSETDLSLEEAVQSYLFNSQIISPSTVSRRNQDGPRMVMICPSQCGSMPAARRLIERWISDPAVPLDEVHYVKLEQSMAGGGGPACLRLRLPCDETIVSRLDHRWRWSEELDELWRNHVEATYPKSLCWKDLRDPQFAQHCLEMQRSGWCSVNVKS